MRFKFFNQAGQILFERNDDESASVVHEEMSLQILYPYDENKVIQRGMLVGYTDVSGSWQVFEIRKAKLYEPDHYQEITAEHICIAELTDEHFKGAEWTNITASAALTALLNGTGWALGTDTSEGVSSANVSMSNVWQSVRSIENNWNVYILPRVTVGASGITGRYLDIIPAGGTWRGLRLSLEKNADELGVTWDDSKVKTALYAYGKSESTTVDGQKVSAPITFEDVVWEATADHPAKPAGQAYLVDPDATAAFGRNGRPRFGYYQNGDISDPEILLQKTWESLKSLNHPDVTIDSLVTDLYRLGYNDVPIRLHDTALTEIRPTGIILSLEIIQYTEDLNDPLQSRVTIGTYIPNIIYINRETNKAAGGGGGGGGGQNDGEFKDSLFVTNIQANELGLAVTSAELTEAKGTIVAQGAQLAIDRTGIQSLAVGTGAQLNADGTLVVDAQGNPIFTTTGSGLYSKIEQNASAINLRVVKGDVATQLSVECGNVSVTGGNLTVDGYVTSAGLASEIADLAEVQVNNINGTRAEFDVLDGTTVYADDLKAGTVTIGNNSFSNVIVSASVSGNVLTLTPLSGSAVTFSKATTLSGSWGSGAYTVTATQNNTAVATNVTSLTNTGHWGSGTGESATTYYGETYATVNGGTVPVDTGNSYTVDALSIFEQATVTPQGEAYGSITPINSGSAMHLGAETTIRPCSGSGIKPTLAKVKVATSNGTYYLRKTSAIKLKHWGDQTFYAAPTTGATSYNHDWYYIDTNGTNYYQSDGTATKYSVADASFYDVGSSNAGKTLYEGGTSNAYRRVLDSGGTTFYTADTAVTNLYKAGTEDQTTYYKKRATS